MPRTLPEGHGGDEVTLSAVARIIGRSYRTARRIADTHPLAPKPRIDSLGHRHWKRADWEAFAEIERPSHRPKGELAALYRRARARARRAERRRERLSARDAEPLHPVGELPERLGDGEGLASVVEV